MRVDVSEYGLDSINIMFLIAKLSERFGVRLDPGELIAYRTLTELAEYVAKQHAV